MATDFLSLTNYIVAVTTTVTIAVTIVSKMNTPWVRVLVIPVISSEPKMQSSFFPVSMIRGKAFAVLLSNFYPTYGKHVSWNFTGVLTARDQTM